MNNRRSRLFALLGLIMAAVFAIDLFLPLGVAAGVLYVLAVLVSVRDPGWHATIWVAVIATVLTIAGFFISAPAGIEWMVLANRILSIGIIWISAYLLIDRNRAALVLRETGHKLDAVFDTVPDGIVVSNEKGLIQTFNRAAEKLFGYSSEDVIGRNLSILMPSSESEAHDKYMEHYMVTGEKRIIDEGREVMARKSDGTVFPVRLAVGEINLHGQKGFVGILHDLTELRTAVKESLEDTTTGLANRRAFDKLLAAALSRGQTSLLLVDIDRLKSINDEMGHLRGDVAIATAANKITTSLRTTDPDACARIGGDEFAVVLPQTGDDDAVRIAERILGKAQPALQAIHPSSGVSIGVASAPQDTTPKELLRMADEALYRAKESRGSVSR
jgi:diguanylate cyclase (GGDEF)-like protein/PAS domain S-box-containing protein